MGSGLAGLSLVLAIVILVIAVLWICVPFLIMGTNRRLDQLLKQSPSVTSKTHVRCPECRELVFKDARKCRYCLTSLVPVPD